MLPTNAYGAQSVASSIAPLQINRRDPGPHDVLLRVVKNRVDGAQCDNY
ncbi:MAG: hypothetical protein ABJC63_07090 [Gemmatimonadales bacterium]